MELVPGAMVDRYVVISRLGAGLMATTYHVRHGVLDTHHALQVPNQHRKGLFRRLVAGAKIQAKLRHTGVVSCTDVLDVEGLPVLVLDHVQGPNLDQLIRYHDLDEARIDSLAGGLFTAVDFLHANSIIHRHLKPKNIIVDMAHGREVPRVTDFTLAATSGTTSMRVREKPRVFGTPSYMSPEQTENSDLVGYRTDLWSVGCILYYMVTGSEAFGAADAEATIAQVRAGLYVPIKRRVPAAPDRWARAIHNCLMVDEDQRMQSAEELAAVWFEGMEKRPLQTVLTAPVGSVTLVFTDIEGSTKLWEANEEVARHSLHAHDAVMRSVLHRFGGYEVKTEGDAFMVAFSKPSAALRFCVEVQLSLHQHPWSDALLDRPEASVKPGFRGLRVRMGVHEGVPECRRRGGKADYYGPMVNRAARIAGSGHGGQILVSAHTWEQADRSVRSAVTATNMGTFELRSLSGTQEIIQIVPTELEDREFPPIKATKVDE
ncbi:MAG: adenylate/guanylate cyclase domain-containing protein [Myxococcota bacterium]